MLRNTTLSLLAAVCASLATGCSSPQESASAAGASPAGASPAGTLTAAPVAALRTSGTRADSLAGIPGHKFGEELSAFPGLVLTPSQKPGSQAYHYPGGKGEPGWFGKRKKESPNEFYSYYIFKDGKFVAFQAVALGAGRTALREQTTYLLGKGTQTSTTTNWEGEKVLAYYSQATLPGAGPSETLDVQSQDFVKGRSLSQAERLKQENAL